MENIGVNLLIVIEDGNKITRAGILRRADNGFLGICELE
jgi:hypothetical protein